MLFSFATELLDLVRQLLPLVGSRFGLWFVFLFACLVLAPNLR